MKDMPAMLYQLEMKRYFIKEYQTADTSARKRAVIKALKNMMTPQEIKYLKQEITK